MSVVASTMHTARTHRSQDDVQAVVQELDTLQQTQQAYVKRIAQEQVKQEMLAMKIQVCPACGVSVLLDMLVVYTNDLQQDATVVLDRLRRQLADLRNSDPTKAARKAIQHKEKQIELARTSLGTTSTEFAQLRTRIDTVRREKLQLYAAHATLEKAIKQKTEQHINIQGEMRKINEQKGKLKSELASVRQQVIGDVESFASELDTLKDKIAKDKIAVPNKVPSPPPSRSAARQRAHTLRSEAEQSMVTKPAPESPLKTVTMQDLQEVLAKTNTTNFQQLRDLVYQNEEEEFHLYQSILSLHESLDRMRAENTVQQSLLAQESQALAQKDGAADTRRREFDAELLSLRVNTQRYETSQQAYLALLKTVAEPLMQAVKSVCPDDSTIEDSSIHSGINDNNVDVALGILEGQVDELIQLSRAAMGEDIGLDDLCKPPEPELDTFGRVPALRAPALQDAAAESDDDDDEESVHPVDIGQLQQGISKQSRPNTRTAQRRPGVAALMMRRGTVGAT